MIPSSVCTRTTTGVAVATFRLAVDRDFKDKQTGERQADFITVVVWRQTAEFVSRFFSKGRMAIVEGKLQTRTYDKDGVRHYITEVVADNVYFGDSKRDEGGKPQEFREPEFTDYTDDGNLPF